MIHHLAPHSPCNVANCDDTATVTVQLDHPLLPPAPLCDLHACEMRHPATGLASTIAWTAPVAS